MSEKGHKRKDKPRKRVRKYKKGEPNSEHNFQGTPKQIRRRAGRNKALASLRKELGEKTVNKKLKKGYETHHLNRNPLDNRLENLKLVLKSKNRADNK